MIYLRTYPVERRYIFVYNDEQPDVMWYIATPLRTLARGGTELSRATSTYYTWDRVRKFPLTDPDMLTVDELLENITQKTYRLLCPVDARLRVSCGL